MRTNTLVSIGTAVLFACGSSNNAANPGSVGGNGPGAAPPDAGLAPPIPPPATASVTVTFSGTGFGRVTSAPAGIDCPGSCSMNVPVGTPVTLTAQPDILSMFVGWGGACSGTSCTFVAAAGASTAFANFMPNPPPDDCAGLVPAPPGAASGAFTASVLGFSNSGSPTVCMPGFADGDGALALQITDGRSGAGHETNFLSPAGMLLSSALDGEVTITEQADGFIDSDFDGQVSLIRYDSRGARGAVTDKFDTVRAIANDPTGGVVALRMEPAGSIDTVTSVILSAYDAHLAPRWQVALPAEPVAMAAVDRAGNTLVIIDGDDKYGPHTVAGIWVDHLGRVGQEFALDGAMPSGLPAHDVRFTVAERVGSGFFVGAEGRWRAQLEAFLPQPIAVPDWLASRPLSNLHVVHGGNGYAVLPNPAQGDCAQTIDIVSPGGKICGSRTFRAAAGACSTGAIRVGYDGTVVQQVPANQKCTWQWWSGYFR